MVVVSGRGRPLEGGRADEDCNEETGGLEEEETGELL
jgi:hypothetical protein